MARWIFCRTCSETFHSGGAGDDLNTELPNTCMSCYVLCVTPNFASQAVADEVMGVGNYTPGDTWALFNNGNDFERDASRPVDVVFTTVADPNDATVNIVSTISIDGGAFVWTRRSNDVVTDPVDFFLFDLTTGDITAKACDCGPCASFNFELHFVALALEDPVEDFEVTVSGLDAGDCDCNETVTLCLKNETPAGSVCDDWRFIESATQGVGSWTSIEDIYGTCDGGGCRDGGLLTISSPGEDCEGLIGTLVVSNSGGGGATFTWTIECGRDPRDAPLVADFVLAAGTGTLDSITYGGDCGEGGSENNCPPDDCPTSWCQWQWNPDTLVWDLIDTNCLEGFECGDPPPDPPSELQDVVWVECNCCVAVTPDCGVGFSPCLGDTCSWVWNAALAEWEIGGGCNQIGCDCHGAPDFDGDFDGDSRFGVCCSEDAP